MNKNLQITQLKQENAHLRALFRVILNTAYQAVNGPQSPEKEPKKRTLFYCRKCGISIDLEVHRDWKYESGSYFCGDCSPKEDKHE